MREKFNEVMKKLGNFFKKFAQKKRNLVITAIVLVLLVIPFGIILSIHNSSYDCSFVYTSVDNIVTEIVQKHVYYNAKDRTVELQLDQDLLNSLIKDNLATMDLDLPDKLSIKEVKFDTQKQTIFINAKYGFLNAPVSAKINVDVRDDGVSIYADNMKLAWMGLPGFIKNQIPKDAINFTVNYKDLDIPEVFSVKEVKFGTGTIKATISLHEDKIVELALDYKKNLMDELDKIKSENSDIVASFIDKLLEKGTLSDEKVKEYVISVLNNEELVNSALLFGVAGNLDKYSTGFEKATKSVEAWAQPLSVVKYYGNIDDTVNNILYNEELKELLTWFLPKDKIEEYVETVEDYYTKYTGVRSALDGVGDDFSSGDWQVALEKILYSSAVADFLSLFTPEEDLNNYMGTAKDYFTKIRDGSSAFETIFASLNDGDYESAIRKISNDKKLKDLISLFMTLEDINSFTGQVSDFYAQYEEITASLDELSAEIDADGISEYCDLLIEYAGYLKDERDYLRFSVSQTDPDKVRELVAYLEEDEGIAGEFIDGAHPDYYRDFKNELGAIEAYKADADALLDYADPEDIDKYVKALEDIKAIVTALKEKDYVKVLEIFDSGNISALAFG